MKSPSYIFGFLLYYNVIRNRKEILYELLQKSRKLAEKT